MSTQQRKRRSVLGGNRGATVLLVIGFIGALALVLGSLSSYAIMQSKYGRAVNAQEQALNLAEAGLEYYRWYLAHNPSVLVDGAGLVTPYVYSLEDPESGKVGQATVFATTSIQCGDVQWVDISSTGIANADQRFPRTLEARYMRPSTAEYSYIVNTDVWAGADRTIRGPYHSNGGIRMDATHNADVTSSAPTWDCTSSYGCNPEQSSAPGVVGSGSIPSLWSWGVGTISFEDIALNLPTLLTKAKTQGGIYYASSTGSISERGYHLVFNSGGTVTIKRVTDTSCVDSKSSQYGWGTECSIINSETTLGTYAIPSTCSLIYLEDRAWVEGTVHGKVTVVAATPDDISTSPDIYLKNNILYTAYDGSDGITLVAERSVLLPLQSPNDMEIHGTFIAQSGHYGRDLFVDSGSHEVPSQYDSYVTRSTLTTIGSVVSNGRTGTSWSCGGDFCGGYATRYDYYDQQFAFSPPPFTPAVSHDYEFVLWREN